MPSKARIAGHPIHPKLLAFPIVLFWVVVAAMILFGLTTLIVARRRDWL